jgi:hypothetical protein
MAILKNKNFASSLLNDGINSSDTSLVVTSAEGTKFPATGYFMGALWGSAYPSPSLDPDRELVKVTLTSGDTFSIARAQEGTTAKSWSAGDNIAAVLTAGKVNEIEVLSQNNLLCFGIATGTNTYTATLDPAVTEYATGMAFNIKFVNASTGASVLGVNALASKKVFKYAQGVYSECVSGDITAGLYSTIFYDSSLDSGGGGWLLATNKVFIPEAFASGTALLFPQASAPSGWTLDSSWSTPRSIIIGNSYGTGGTATPTTFTTGITVAAHATHLHSGPNHSHTVIVNGHILTVAQLAVHAHSYTRATLAYYGASGSYGDHTVNVGTANTSTAGSGQAHSHTASSGASGTGNTGYGGPTTHVVGQSTYSPRYMTVIRCTKN